MSHWLLYQLADSAFPAGAFAHSGGLEAAWQHGRVAAGASLEGFLRAQLVQIQRGAMPFVAAAHREPGRWGEWDAACDVMLNNHVANQASRAQGQAFLSAASRIFPEAEVRSLSSQMRAEKISGHLSPVFGVVARGMGIDLPASARLFMFTATRGLISAAVRLGIVGPIEGQRIQMTLAVEAQSRAEAALQILPKDAAQTAPLFDLLQATHGRLYSRLFQS